MKPALSRLLLAALAASLFGCGTVNVVKPEGMQLPPLEFPMRSLVYPSGLRVVVEHDERTQLAGVFVVVGSGSANDPVGKEGLAHYIEHLTFRSRPAGRATFWDSLDAAGAATFNAFTSFDETVYYEVGLASRLGDLLQLEGRRMANPVALVSDAERATELDVVRNELRLKNETGHIGEVLNAMQAAVYPAGHPYVRAIGGTHESMEAIQHADVDAYLRAHYTPDNMTMVILGNVDLATADKLVWDSLPHKLLEAAQPIAVAKRIPDAVPPVPESPPQPASLPKLEAPVTSPELWVAWTLPRAYDASAYLALYVAGVTRGVLGRVQQDDKDITAIGCEVLPDKEASMLLCTIQLRNGENPQASLDRVMGQLPKLWNNFTATNTTFGEVSFGRTRRVAVIDEVSAAQNLGTRGLSRAMATHFAGDPTLYSRTVKSLTEMRQEKVKEYGAPYVTRERARAILFVPPAGTGGAKGDRASAPAGMQSSTAAQHPQNLPAGWETGRIQELLAGPKEHERYQLPNGLTVILKRRTGLPLLSAAIMFPAVPSTPEEAAASQLVEDVGGIQMRYENVFGGGGKSEALLNGAPEAIGARIRRARSDDHVSYSIEGANGNADLLLALLAEYPRTVSVDRFGVVAFQEYAIPWLKREEKDPFTLARRQFESALLAGSPYGIVVGSQELEAATQSAAAAWIKKIHTPSHATLVVVGDFELAAVKKLIADSFGNWAADPAAAATPIPPALTASESAVNILVTPRPDATQSAIEFGCLLPETTDGQISAQHKVAAHVLNERLWNAVRIKLGATYGVGASASVMRGGTSYLTLSSAVETSKLGPSLAAIQEALSSLAEKPATADEVAWAKVKYANGLAVKHMENRGVIASSIGGAALGFAPDGRDLAEAVDAVTAEAIQADFKACLVSRPTLSIVGDETLVRAALKEAWH